MGVSVAQDLISLLATPLSDLRGYWLEETCCREPVRSPVWYHAARWPGWLLSDLALDHTCGRCGAMPALALLPQDRCGRPMNTGRIEVITRFEEN